MLLQPVKLCWYTSVDKTRSDSALPVYLRILPILRMPKDAALHTLFT